MMLLPSLSLLHLLVSLLFTCPHTVLEVRTYHSSATQVYFHFCAEASVDTKLYYTYKKKKKPKAGFSKFLTVAKTLPGKFSCCFVAGSSGDFPIGGVRLLQEGRHLVEGFKNRMTFTFALRHNNVAQVNPLREQGFFYIYTRT